MKRELFDRWIAALKSGEYEQGCMYLCKNHPTTEKKRYCCLGILLELDGVLSKEPEMNGTYYVIDEKNPTIHNCASIPTFKCQEYGMDALGHPLDISNVTSNVTESLSRLNDKGTPFKDIASFLEKNWQVYIKELTD